MRLKLKAFFITLMIWLSAVGVITFIYFSPWWGSLALLGIIIFIFMYRDILGDLQQEQQYPRKK